MSINILLSVAAGGALGAVGRYLVMSGVGHWLGTGFPYATLTVNILGSFILGSIVEVMALTWSPGQEARAFLVVGVLGAFTTFSTFSLDTVTLIDRGDIMAATAYIGASVIVCVVGFYAGMHLLRQVLT
jgi:CrcB protein